MTNSARPAAPLYTQLDIGPTAASSLTPVAGAPEQNQLLHDILMAMDRQNELMEELIGQVASGQKQRANELMQWKEANPRLAQHCRIASESLARVQTEFLATLTSEINDNPDSLIEGEFFLNEFIDKYGPRLAHLNGVLQVLAQLGSAANPPLGQ